MFHLLFISVLPCSYHLSIVVDTVVSAMLGVFSVSTGHLPKFRACGGSERENVALQNIQARVRMISAYLYAQVNAKNTFIITM
jgi:NAD+ synthase (glutamine-hydrolysing)